MTGRDEAVHCLQWVLVLWAGQYINPRNELYSRRGAYLGCLGSFEQTRVFVVLDATWSMKRSCVHHMSASAQIHVLLVLFGSVCAGPGADNNTAQISLKCCSVTCAALCECPIALQFLGPKLPLQMPRALPVTTSLLLFFTCTSRASIFCHHWPNGELKHAGCCAWAFVLSFVLHPRCYRCCSFEWPPIGPLCSFLQHDSACCVYSVVAFVACRQTSCYPQIRSCIPLRSL